MAFVDYFHDFLDLLFPRTCPTCGIVLNRNDNWLCSSCIIDMPESDYWKIATNPVNQIFWGRVPIVFASAYLLFSKGSKYRQLIHRLKYKGDQESGIQLGKYFGNHIKRESLYPKIDYIIPVPLHSKKEKKRGYNQSACIAEGLSSTLNVPVLEQILYRKLNTRTQTKMNREERWHNVSEAFAVNHPEILSGKHILIVDDVITTGVTIEHCAKILNRSIDCKISIACIARA